MSSQVLLGVVAIVLGLGIGAVVFVPVVAVRYRRHGAVTLRWLATSAAALVYFMALWTYTLLPLPDPDTIQCAGTNLRPFAFLGDFSAAYDRAGGSLRALLTDAAILQTVLNVALFVPLGFFLRVLGRRGIVVAGLTGLAVSLLIETTQLTGVWGIYPCAYRVFDVDDLLTNTTGALLGSIAALLVPPRFLPGAPGAAADVPRPVTRTRRLLAMACDWLALTVVGYTVAVAVQAYLVYGGHREVAVETQLGSTVGLGVGLAVAAVVTLATGRSIGDLAVRLRYADARLPTAGARLVRFLAGIGGYGLLALVPATEAASGVFAAVAVLAALVTRAGRGLPGLLGAGRLVDSRAQDPSRAPEGATP